MKVQKLEFVIEIILSLMIVSLAVELGGSGEFYAAMIAMVHSFNIARAIEAYKEAQTQQEYQSTLDQ